MSKLKLSTTAGAALAAMVAVSSSAVAQSATARATAACDTVSMLRDSTNVDASRLARLNTSCGRTRLASSSRRIPITKGETAMRVDTLVRVDTVTVSHVDTVASAPIHDTVTVVDTVRTAAGVVAEPPVVIRHYGNGFYFGIGGGATMPAGGIRDAYNTGYNVSVPFGWDSQTGPFGLRFDVTYDQMHARSTLRSSDEPLTVAGLTTVNPQIWSGMADLKLRLPFDGQFAGSRTGLYVIGGVGAHYLRNYSSTFAVTNPATNVDEGAPSASLNSNGSLWRFGANAGGGITFGLGNANLFVESRYVRIFTSSERTNYVPIILGLSLR